MDKAINKAKSHKLDNIQDVKEQQILPCKVMGEWDFSFRTTVFIIQNAPETRNTSKI